MSSSRKETQSYSLKHAESSTLKRSEEHTSELQSRLHLVCRLLLEKKKKKITEESSYDNEVNCTYMLFPDYNTTASSIRYSIKERVVTCKVCLTSVHYRMMM